MTCDVSVSTERRHALRPAACAPGHTAPSAWLLSILATLCAPVFANDIYVYPAGGQSDQQLGQDRYECHRWAVAETGYDPMRITDAEPPRVVRVPVQRNEAAGATAKGAVGGALAGAVIGAGSQNHGGGGEGAIIGAVVGTLVGAAIEGQGESNARVNAEAEAQRQSDEIAQDASERALRRANYQRAITACLEGRSYTVR